MLGGLLADWVGLRMVFIVTAVLLLISFLVTRFLIKETGYTPISKKDKLSGREVFASLDNPRLMLCLFVTTMVIRCATVR
nr:drug efflux system protein MdtG [Candidatus Pantoea persica]